MNKGRYINTIVVLLDRLQLPFKLSVQMPNNITTPFSNTYVGNKNAILDCEGYIKAMIQLLDYSELQYSLRIQMPDDRIFRAGIWLTDYADNDTAL